MYVSVVLPGLLAGGHFTVPCIMNRSNSDDCSINDYAVEHVDGGMAERNVDEFVCQGQKIN